MRVTTRSFRAFVLRLPRRYTPRNDEQNKCVGISLLITCKPKVYNSVKN